MAFFSGRSSVAFCEATVMSHFWCRLILYGIYLGADGRCFDGGDGGGGGGGKDGVESLSQRGIDGFYN